MNQIGGAMRAAILARQHEPLVIDEVSLPSALDVGQVLVRVHFTGICGSQLGEIDGVKGPDRHLPHLLGHEGSGTVEAIGPGVRRVKPGDRVVLHWRKTDGIEAATPRYKWRDQTLNAGWVTTFNELAVVSENRLTPIATDMDLDVAAMLGCPVTTGLGAITNDARLTIGESVVVLGTGGVGLVEIMAAKLVSAHPIVAVDLTKEKLDLARQLGASITLDSGDDLEARVRAVIGKDGADVVIENTGNGALIALAGRLAKSEGRVVLVGVPQTPTALDTLPMHFGQRWVGSHGGGANPERDIPRCIELYRRGQLPLQQLITDRCSLNDINPALQRLRAGAIAGRCVVAVSAP